MINQYLIHELRSLLTKNMHGKYCVFFCAICRITRIHGERCFFHIPNLVCLCVSMHSHQRLWNTLVSLYDTSNLLIIHGNKKGDPILTHLYDRSRDAIAQEGQYTQKSARVRRVPMSVDSSQCASVLSFRRWVTAALSGNQTLCSRVGWILVAAMGASYGSNTQQQHM